ncbi:MAG: ribosome recycling factor [Polyangiaceae bacterium]|jgi:ribosome recycling factor|nr:ribosome recycling factor [Polyangiaceae bacterium]MBK8936969.1 ribosome recycling factor [Polyangiaceae bacterium]
MLDDVLKEMRASADKSLESLRRDLVKVRTGRAHPSMLDGIRVDYYGASTPLSQMANINVPEPRMMTVKPWDKGQVKAVDKAIREGDLGLNPQVDGDVIRLPIPALTEERRKDLVKVIRKNGEECKVAIRKHRREALEMIDTFQKDGDVSEDDADRGRKKVEDLTSELVKQVDGVIASKEKDVMEV